VSDPSPWVGAAYLAAFATAGVLLRGSAPDRRFLLLPAGLTLAIWAVFHSWWLPSNFEWLVPFVALLAAAMAALARGEPAAPPAIRRAGAVMLMGLAAWFLVAGAPNLARFRERRLAEAVEDTAALGRGARYVGVGGRAQVVLEILGLEPDGVDDRASIEDIIVQVGKQVARSPGRVIVIADRFALDPAPRSADRPRLPFDSIEDRPGTRFLRRDGLVYGALFDAAAAESR
jgi:hypothetical protein